jgi:hypothetical protein
MILWEDPPQYPMAADPSNPFLLDERFVLPSSLKSSFNDDFSLLRLIPVNVNPDLGCEPLL